MFKTMEVEEVGRDLVGHGKKPGLYLKGSRKQGLSRGYTRG